MFRAGFLRSLCTVIILIAAGAVFNSFADTFTEIQTGKILTGFAIPASANGKTIVRTPEAGIVHLDISDYNVQYNSFGRENTVYTIPITDHLTLHAQADAIIEAIHAAANKGALLIILQIDSPGGKVHLAKQITSAIIQTARFTPIAAHIKSGQFGGAFSAAALIAISCEKIYIAPASAIGAAAPVVSTKKGYFDIGTVYGSVVGETYNTA